ncbi:MAG: hypothetical protein AAGA67_00585, partial [Cyanobacteria bacterium P01_F01_bin.153]
ARPKHHLSPMGAVAAVVTEVMEVLVVKLADLERRVSREQEETGQHWEGPSLSKMVTSSP